MKIRYLYYFIIIIFFILFCQSCFKLKSINIKYREKNPISELNINASNGNIDIIGWSKNFIEIIGNKKLITGINTDIDQMDIIFNRKNKIFYITTKVPARLNGKIDILINIPYSLLKINIISNNSNINIEKYLGNLDITNKTGSIIFDFYGNFLRVKSENSKIDFNILGYNSCDVSINNNSGNTICDVINCSSDSYLDIFSEKGNINLNIAKYLPHTISAINKKFMFNIDYTVNKQIYYNGSYNYFKANYGNTKNNLKINLTNLNNYSLIHLIQ